jgi:flagellar biosynthesis protein FlhG
MNEATLSVAIVSGKGGVGKSNLALNLGYALSRAGIPLLLMDCDLGLANLDVLLGITPEGNLQDVILRDAPVRDIILPLGANGRGEFDILPAASGVPELAEMDANMRKLLLRRLEPELQQYGMVLLDLGAGINGTVQAFAAMAAVRLVVMTTEPTSLTDSYALMKVLHANLGIKDFLVVVNEVNGKKEETEPFQRLCTACERFLGFTPVLLGTVRTDPKMSESVRRQTPLLEAFPQSPASRDIQALARKLPAIRTSMLKSLKGKPVLRPLPKI